MFPSRYEIKGQPKTRYNQHNIIQSTFQPHINELTYSLSDFGNIDELVQKINPRNFLLFGASRGYRIPGLEPGTYTVTCDLHAPFQKEERRTKKTTIHHSIDGDYSNLLLLFPQSQPVTRLLDRIKEMDDSTLSCGPNLIDRAKRFDEYLAKHSESYLSRALPHFFDPNEQQLWEDIRKIYSSLARNTNLVQHYFRQMASLMLLGSFSDTVGMKTLTGIKGIRSENIASVVSSWSLPGYDGSVEITNVVPDPKRTTDLTELLASDTPWYKNTKLAKPLNISTLIKEFNKLGRANRMPYQDESATTVSAVAAESIINDIYQSATGQNSQRSDTLETKLKAIAKKLDGDKLLQPYIDIYKAEKKITPAIIRGGVIHAGSPGQGPMDDVYDQWTQFYYDDLIKTIITLIAGQPRAYFDFDHYARWMNIINDKDKPAAFVPIDISKPFELLDL